MKIIGSAPLILGVLSLRSPCAMPFLGGVALVSLWKKHTVKDIQPCMRATHSLSNGIVLQCDSCERPSQLNELHWESLQDISARPPNLPWFQKFQWKCFLPNKFHQLNYLCEWRNCLNSPKHRRQSFLPSFHSIASQSSTNWSKKNLRQNSWTVKEKKVFNVHRNWNRNFISVFACDKIETPTFRRQIDSSWTFYFAPFSKAAK